MPNYWHKVNVKARPETLGCSVQTSYVEGRWHRNSARNRPPKFFGEQQQKLVKNGIFLLSARCTRNEDRYWDGP